MNHNIAHHITALHKQMEAKTTLNLIPSYAIMVEPETTAQDMERYLNRLSTLELTESQLIVLFTMLQNDLINVIEFLHSLIWLEVGCYLMLSPAG